MNFKFVIAWSSLWLPLTIGQGCPYSRTVVPGDAKRYIEMVHNIAHERHCAPGTEFDPTTCECSLLSSGAWSPGLAFIDGLATAYPELANMPLDVLQKELLLLSSPTMYPMNVNTVPSSFQKPTRLNNQRQQQMLSPSSLNTQQILDLFQNVRPEDIPPHVLNDLEHLMFLENGPSGSNIFPTQNVVTHLPSRHNNERTFIPAQNEHVVGEFRNMRTQNQLRNPGSHSQNPSQLVTTKPTPTIQDIKDLIASFQNLLTKPTLQSNIKTPLSQTHSTQNPTIQKKNALDNFQSLANSILKAFPPKTSTPTRPSLLVSPVASPPTRNHSPSSVPIGMRTSRTESDTQNTLTRNSLLQNNIDKTEKLSETTPLAKQRQLPQVNTLPKQWIYWGNADGTKTKPALYHRLDSKTEKKTERLSEAPPLAKPKVNTLPKQWIYWSNADGTKTKPALYHRLDSKTEKKTERLSEAPPLAKQKQLQKVNTLPKQWIYWGNADGTNTKPAVNHLLDSKAETMKMDQSKTNIKSSTQIDRVLSVQKLTTPVMQPVNKSQRELSKYDTKIQKTPPPTKPKPASPSEDKTSNPQEEMSATKLLKMIKKQLREAKNTGKLPFSLLKTLLEKRSMLMKQIKEERRRKKNKKSQDQPESKKSNKLVDKQENETIKSKPVNEQKSLDVLQEKKENLETISTSEKDSSKGENLKQVNEPSTSEQKQITNHDSEAPHTGTKSNENQQTVQNVIPNFSFSSGASQPSIQGTDHNRPKSKRRKSKTAEFSYKPAQNGISSQSYDLLSLLSGKPILELIPSRKVSTPVEKSTPQLRGLGQTIPNNSPQLDLFSRTTSTKSRQSSTQLNTPLLDQDLATITAFLRERNALKSVNPRTVRNSYVAESYPTTLTKTPEKSHVRTLTLPTEKPKPLVQLTQPESTQSKLKTVNKQQAGSLPSLSKIDEQKRLILQKLMQRLSALQAQSSNSGNGVSMNGQSAGNNRQSVNNNGQSIYNNGQSFNNNGHSVNNNGMSQQNSNSQFNGMPTLRQSPSTAGQASSKSSPYHMMFRSIAMKEGASDAQEIMQDRMTEMGGAGVLSMGMPMSAMNSEVRSHLGSTLFENSPMAFLL